MSEFRIEHGGVSFHLPGGIFVHIRQADDNKADIVVVQNNSRISVILSAEELIDLLAIYKNGGRI